MADNMDQTRFRRFLNFLNSGDMAIIWILIGALALFGLAIIRSSPYVLVLLPLYFPMCFWRGGDVMRLGFGVVGLIVTTLIVAAFSSYISKVHSPSVDSIYEESLFAIYIFTLIEMAKLVYDFGILQYFLQMPFQSSLGVFPHEFVYVHVWTCFILVFGTIWNIYFMKEFYRAQEEARATGPRQEDGVHPVLPTRVGAREDTEMQLSGGVDAPDDTEMQLTGGVDAPDDTEMQLTGGVDAADDIEMQLPRHQGDICAVQQYDPMLNDVEMQLQTRPSNLLISRWDCPAEMQSLDQQERSMTNIYMDTDNVGEYLVFSDRMWTNPYLLPLKKRPFTSGIEER